MIKVPTYVSASKNNKKSSRKDISDYSIQEIESITNKKRILIFAGCYCPFHAGHYNIISEVINELKPDIVMIKTTNSSTNPRHGVPLEHTLKTLKEWGKILRDKYDIDIFIANSDNYLNMWKGASKNTKSITEVIIHDKDMDKKYLVNPMELLDLSNRSRAYFEKMPRNDDNFYIYHIQRKNDGLSATNFVKCLKDPLKKCREFVPDDVDDKDGYVRNIRQKYGNYLK